MTGFGSNSGQMPPRSCSPPRRRNILAAAANGVGRFIARWGGDADRVLGRAGIDADTVLHPKAALDLGRYVTMMELAAAETGNDNFGLWYGQEFTPEMLGLIGEIAIASPTLGSAVENLALLFPYHQHATETRLRVEGDLLHLEYRILDGQIVERRQDAELTMGMYANVFRHCLGQSWEPEEVFFEHPTPEGWRDHEQAFRAPIHFGQRTNALVFRDKDLGRPMPKADLTRLVRLREELLRIAGGTGQPSFLNRIQGEIRSRLPEGNPHIEDVAQSLGQARWTLQRRLSDQGLSFSDLVDGVRRDLARLHLRQRHIPVADIGFILGYSEVSAFSRACRRWFGTSPQKIRQSDVVSTGR
ncbi:AraC family transcriptional regulator [Telmatospirillum sp.]|uniref:AraC-like transcriptional regulator QhpR n=1 Tax=Telmatospirillum sp. TaxID=2079197 RepID=UPI00285056B4|nr:AraC family transcriptional regulator [Telmatospirillum sp.]MDR3437006.1 AraC family transcriptional regulator [Telmatospirillum sp.]